MRCCNKYRSFAALVAVVFFLATLAGPAASAEVDDAITAARSIMTAIAQKNYDQLWDETADWYKTKFGIKKASFLANWTLSRLNVGNLKSLNVLDSSYATSDPTSGYTGKIYFVTFQNSYENGNAYERMTVVEENKKFKLINFFGAPAP